MKKLLILLSALSLIRFLILIIKQKQKFIKTFLQSLVVLTAASLYLLPIKDNLHFYGKNLKEIPLFNWLLTDLPIIKKLTSKILIINNLGWYSNLIKNILHKSPFIIFFITYFLIIKLGKKLNIPYFIRYNMMHSILISLAQVPIMHCYTILNQFITLNPFLKIFSETLALSLILFTFFIIFYSILYTSLGYYLYIPLITDSSVLHLGDK